MNSGRGCGGVDWSKTRVYYKKGDGLCFVVGLGQFMDQTKRGKGGLGLFSLGSIWFL